MKDDLRCSTVTRALAEDPCGTAPDWHTIHLLELPLPWPDEIGDHPELEGLGPWPDGERVLALADTTRPGDHDGTVVERLVYRRDPAEPFTGFSLDGARGTGDGLPVTDLLICTHGTRDRCCGKLGMQLFDAVCGQVPEGTRRWRTSHTGGHRFAPTALTLPDGCLWAHLDADLLLGILDRSADPVVAARHLRGAAGLGDARAQLADRAGLANHGWDWLAASRWVKSLGDDHVELAWLSDSLGSGTVRLEVRPGEPVPVPPCGEPLDQATKATPSWTVEGVVWR